MNRGPSCPGCGSPDHIETFSRFWCTDCNLIFSGSEDEWKRGSIGGLHLHEHRKRGGLARFGLVKEPVEP